MKPHVLFISIDGMTDPLGQSQVIPYLAGISKQNFNVTILSAEKDEKRLVSEEKVSLLLESLGINWVRISYKNSAPLVSQALNYNALLTEAAKICRSTKISLIHARSYIPSLVGLSLKKKFNIPFLFDMRGFWADERLEGKIWTTKNPFHKSLYSFFKRKEKEFLKHSSHIISLTQNARSEILNWDLKLLPNKITVIPCCADFSLFSFTADHSAQKAVREKLNINPNSFVLTYSGSLGTWYMLTEMLQFFKQLLNKKPDAIFLILTTDKKEIVFKEAAKLGIPTDHFRVVSAARDEMPAYLSISDFCIFFIRPSFSKKASSPTKLAEILGCGIPVITNSGVGDVDSILNSEACGYLIDTFKETEYQRTIDQIDKGIFEKEKLRAGAIKNFDLNKGINSYISVYNSILNG